MQIYLSVFSRKFGFFLFGLFSFFSFTTLTSPNILAAPSDVDFAFGSKVIDSLSVKKSVIQPDGKILLAGGFDVIVSQPQKYMIRLNTDGTRDASFSAAAPGQIDDFVLQPDGKIVVVGRFFYGFSTCNGFNQCYGIMRLNANGSSDTTFRSGITPNGSQFVNTVVMQPDGKFIIGGQFNVYDGQTRGLVARINTDGTLDPTFQNPNVNNGAFGFAVNSLALQTDGKVVIGGIFDTVSGQTRISLARLNGDGTLDAAFVPPTISGTFTNVAAIAIQSDGKILIGGVFTTIGGQSRSLARLNTDGSLDSTYQNTNFSGNYQIARIFIQPDGKVFLDGFFPGGIQVPGGGIKQKTKARTNADGTLDATLNLDTLNDVYGVAAQANGRILVIGTFAPPINGNTSVDYFLVREIDLDNQANAIAVQPNGRILIGGIFNYVTGQPRKGLARLNADGTLDTTFPNLNLTFTGDFSITGVRKIVVQTDGKIIIIGGFTNVGGVARNRLARLNADGSVDTTFVPPTITFGSSDFLTDAVLQADGKIILGGNFSTVGGQTRNSIIRLNTDGSLDAAFQNPFSSSGGVRSLAVQSDGKIIVGGTNIQIGNQGRALVRLNADGSLDNTLQNVPVNDTQANNGTVNDIRIQTDGKILIGGVFTSVGGATRKFIARLNIDGTVDTTFQDPIFTGSNGIYKMAVQADGKIIVTGSFFSVGGQTRNGLARINADGTVDTTFGDVGSVTVNIYLSHALAIQRDGKILLGGSFQLVAQRVQPWITRLLGTPIFVPRNTEYDFDGDGKADGSVFRNGVWYIQPSSGSGGFYGVQFGLPTDKLAPADYDGDGKTDIAVWREGAFSYFYILQSATNTVRVEQFGQTGDSPLAVADWDGDGKADPAVYRPAQATGGQSYFFYRPSATPAANFVTVYWGTGGDIPQRGDFDGDGKTDAAVFRPSDGVWYIRQSSNSQTRFEQWGLPTDKFVPADYDGDGKTDLAVYRNGNWYIRQSSNNQPLYRMWGAASDTLVPADYDGDGKTDIAVWRGGIYYILQSSNTLSSARQFGAAGDIPIESVYVQ